MFDRHIFFADKVSFLLKTRYRHTSPSNMRFHLAFTEVADKYHVPGEHRGTLKSEIGSILRKRQRKTRRVSAISSEKEYIFTILRFVDTIEFISEGITFKFGKNTEGIPVLHSYYGASKPSPSLKRAAQNFAENLFSNPLFATHHGVIQQSLPGM